LKCIMHFQRMRGNVVLYAMLYRKAIRLEALKVKEQYRLNTVFFKGE
jgi:hypothetical protein